MFDIDRIAIHNLFGIQGLDIAWYGITMASAIIVGVWVACWQAKKKGYKADLIFDFMILAIPLGIIGARIYYAAFEWDYYSQHPEEILAVWNGGIAMYGSVIGGCLAGFILCKWRKYPFGRLMDFVGPGVAIGQAIGRWGNFFNQEAFGSVVTDPALQWFPYAVYVQYRSTGHGLIVQDSWVQATFFYESVWDIGVFLLLIWYAKRAKHDGNVFAMYLAAYGLGRAWIEGLRVSTLQLWPGMPVSQFLSFVLIAGGVLYIVIMHVKNPANRAYEGMYCLDYADPKDKGKKAKKGTASQSDSTDAQAEASSADGVDAQDGSAATSDESTHSDSADTLSGTQAADGEDTESSDDSANGSVAPARDDTSEEESGANGTQSAKNVENSAPSAKSTSDKNAAKAAEGDNNA